MRKFILSGIMGVITSLSMLPAEACAPYIQPSYMVDETPYCMVINKKIALSRMVRNMDDLFSEFPKYPIGISTMDAVKQDFQEAVNKYLVDKSETEKSHLVMHYISFVKRQREKEGRENFPKMFLPDELQEFALYRQGIYEAEYNAWLNSYEGGEFTIPKSWEKLLELPPEQRHYRTTWVYFMIGNHYYKDSYNDKANFYYKKCIEAFNDGFADTAGLAHIAYERAYVFGDFVKEIKWWVYNIDTLEGHFFDTYFNKCKYWLTEEECLKLLEDPVCREMLLIFAPKHETFVANMGKYKFRNIDILAFYAYSNGEIDKALEYISLLEKPTLLSYWVEAKIARHNGDIDLAVEKLRVWLKLAEGIDPDEQLLNRYEEYDPHQEWCLDVFGLLGNAMVFKGDFVEAAKQFAKVDQYESDLSIVIDKYLTLDDLINLAPLHTLFSESAFKEAFRQGKYDIAAKYGSKLQQNSLEKYLNYIERSEDVKLSNDERALALYNAAVIMRYNGMELCGSNIDPDNARWGGDFSSGYLEFPNNYYNVNYLPSDCFPDVKWCTCKYDNATGYWIFCDTHAKHFDADKLPGLGAEIDFRKVPKHLRFHYRYRAAKLLLQAGDLAEDKDLKALINMFGGFCMVRSRYEADIFYKRLVIGSKGTEWSKEADRIRWFPKSNALDDLFYRGGTCYTMDEVKKVMGTKPVKLEEYEKKINF